MLHIGHEEALAFALLYHALQVIPLIAAGLIFELRLVLGREGDPNAASVLADPAPPDVPAPPPPATPPSPSKPPPASATHTPS